ncbi:molybdenum ABC transporter ATP-binding protein [Massilia sp. DWR3-1-1]|uniref:molybdenum ABC transporter ATP-binding protein n=1 Tax=Massilia sp. DWR3-1-1 TaxID=2804559 RepID=UPI003CF37713
MKGDRFDPAAPIEVALTLARGTFSMQLELTLPARGVSALFGHSGSGKTTVLRAIAGLDRHAGGQVVVNGDTWQDERRGVFVPPHRRSIGYVFQEASLFSHLSVAGNLEFARKRAGGTLADSAAALARAIDLLGIGHLLARRATGLSGGERQRVAIARALLTRPRLMLLDEPLASLDGKRKEEVLPYLESMQRELGIPMVYVSHSTEEVARLADHVVLLEAGKVITSGPAAQTLARLDVSMALSEDAGMVVDGISDGYDAPYGLLRLRVGSHGAMFVAHAPVADGASVRLRVLARDVSLTLSAHGDSSIMNQLRAQVVATWPASDAAHVVVRLDAGGAPLLARITRRSHDQLGLTAGLTVWAQVKATALLSLR